MILISKFKSALFTFVLVTSLSISGSLYAQQGYYSGNEAKLETATLITSAKNTDFSDNICASIFKDEKNTYYAVDVNQLPSTYEKIRILELSYEDKALVNIGSDINSPFFLFLVNNTLNKSSEEIEDLFTSYSTQSKTELEGMSNEQLRLWLLQHDKKPNK